MEFPVSRRSFLAGLAAGSGAVVASSALETLLAANQNAAQAARTLSTDFVYGILLTASPESVHLQVPGYTPEDVRVMLDNRTQICRGNCHANWSALRKGDRVASATYLGPNGTRVARWMNANTVAGMATIKSIAGNVITITALGYGGGEWDLVVGPETSVFLFSGIKVTGSTKGLSVGDSLHFTSTAEGGLNGTATQ